MSNNKQDDFYIGWVGKAPKPFAASGQKFVLVLLPVVVIVAVLLAVAQKKFGTGNFDFGTLTEVRGIYYDKPVPNIRVVAGFGIWGNNSVVTIPLIGYGKFGAEGVIAEIEKNKRIALNSNWVTVKGTLLYNDGKALMQVDGNDNPITDIAAVRPHPMVIVGKQLGNVTVKGEIIDPKCYFGVMKPGEGKPHKDCAIRCILGGMPPMLHAMDGKGASNYYLIVGAGGETINTRLKDYVAAPVEINAKAVQYNDWVVLYVNAAGGIKATSKSAIFQPSGRVIACATSICR